MAKKIKRIIRVPKVAPREPIIMTLPDWVKVFGKS